MALKAVLDTRFFFAYFNPVSKRQEEWCKSVVLEATRAGSALVMSVITISELYENMGKLVGRDAVRIRIASVKAKGISVAAVDEAIATEAGNIKLSTPGLPLADAIIAATSKALIRPAIVLTDDPDFVKIKGLKTHWVE